MLVFGLISYVVLFHFCRILSTYAVLAVLILGHHRSSHGKGILERYGQNYTKTNEGECFQRP